MFPQRKLSEPNECIFVIPSMVRPADASFRRRRGSVGIQGAKRAYRRSKAQEKAGVISLVSSVLLSNQFYAKRVLTERSQPGRSQTRLKGITKCRTTLCLRFFKSIRMP